MQRIPRSPVVLALAGTLATMLGCGAARPSKFYTLEVPASPVISGNPYPVALLVGRITAPHLYRDDRIVYRVGNTQLGAYEYHRWAEPPADTLESLLVRALRSSGNYRSVQSLRSNARGDYLLRGRIHELGEVNGTSTTARVDFEVELFQQKTGTVVWSKHYNVDEPVGGRDVPAVVEALNRNLTRAIDQIVAGLADYFSKNPPQP